MDNITHSIVGLAEGEAAVQWLGSAAWRRAFWTVSIAANNLPDSDAFLTGLTPGKLGYLLQHRGYTHTVPLILPQAFLVFVIWWLWTRYRRVPFSRREAGWIFGLAVLGVVLHTAMDALNSFGVHPFWPWDPRWFYGDCLFIIEPSLWVLLIPPLFWSAGKAWRWVLAGLFILALALCWGTGYVPRSISAVLTLLGLAGFSAYRRAPPGWRIVLGLASSVAVILVFALSAVVVRRDLRLELARAFPDQQVSDLVLTPLPADPFCWQVIGVATDEAGNYFLNHGIAAPFPSWKPAADCPRLTSEAGQAPTDPPPHSATPALRWIGVYRQRQDVLRQAAHQSCGVAAWLRFARAPFIEKEARSWIVGDLRFDRLGPRAFSTMPFAEGGQCPPRVPGWPPPRSAWLSSPH